MVLTKTCYHETNLQEIININIRFLKTILKVIHERNNLHDAMNIHHIYYSWEGGHTLILPHHFSINFCGKLANRKIMYLCARGTHFTSFYWIFDMFRKCRICLC